MVCDPPRGHTSRFVLTGDASCNAYYYFPPSVAHVHVPRNSDLFEMIWFAIITIRLRFLPVRNGSGPHRECLPPIYHWFNDPVKREIYSTTLHRVSDVGVRNFPTVSLLHVCASILCVIFESFSTVYDGHRTYILQRVMGNECKRSSSRNLSSLLPSPFARIQKL